MKVDESGWKWMKLDKMDEKWMKVVESSFRLVFSFPLFFIQIRPNCSRCNTSILDGLVNFVTKSPRAKPSCTLITIQGGFPDQGDGFSRGRHC